MVKFNKIICNKCGYSFKVIEQDIEKVKFCPYCMETKLIMIHGKNANIQIIG